MLAAVSAVPEAADDRVELDVSTRLAYNRTRRSKVILTFLTLMFSLTEGVTGTDG